VQLPEGDSIEYKYLLLTEGGEKQWESRLLKYFFYFLFDK
jgi:hypothetical protein